MLSADDLKQIRKVVREEIKAETGPINSRLDEHRKRLNNLDEKADSLAEGMDSLGERVDSLSEQNERDHNEIIDKLVIISEAEDQKRKELEKRVDELEVHTGLKSQKN